MLLCYFWNLKYVITSLRYTHFILLLPSITVLFTEHFYLYFFFILLSVLLFYTYE